MAQHISVRVPWHDNGWNGTVCKDPALNSACLKLKTICDGKNDKEEESICGQCMLGYEQQLCCIGEGSAFMSNVDLTRTTRHPYADINKETHGHFIETTIRYPAYSFPTKPFAWLMKWKDREDNISKLVNRYNIDYVENREPNLRFDTIWVQEADNQRAILDRFYGCIEINKSIVIAYAKQVPFVEDHRRVVIGMGHITSIDQSVEHERSNKKNTLRSVTWETPVHHSIRPDHNDGFIIPYKEMMEYADSHPDFDISSITVFAPDEARTQFSYATEHITHDSLIEVILSCIKAFEIINKCLDEDYSNVLRWLNEKLTEVWEDRGAFPGLGSMLTALGLQMGMLVAKEIKDKAEKKNNLWELVDSMFHSPSKILSKDLAKSINGTLQSTWKNMSDERKTLFKLLSRFSLDFKQAESLYLPEKRKMLFIECSDKEIIKNPYVLYEKARLIPDMISVKMVDKAIFPVQSILDKYPVPSPSCLKSEIDERRIRALVVHVLEDEANNGNTILPCYDIVDKIAKLELDPSCKLNSDNISGCEMFLQSEVIKREMKDGTEYYKLTRIDDFDKIIEKRVKDRMTADPILYANDRHDWNRVLTYLYGDPSTKQQQDGRKEQVAILDMLATSRLSVLIGEAGTGKTSILSVLCSLPEIKNAGVLLLAPTGKATVRLRNAISRHNKNMDGIIAKNIAQFLSGCGGYDGNKFRYVISKIKPSFPYKTVIIDEASMLTEEMMGSLLNSISTATRIIFVGDPNQLPPIGSGRPFVDLVNLFKMDVPTNSFPKKSSHFGELTINHRQNKDGNADLRKDVALAKFFTSSEQVKDYDVIGDILTNKSSNIEFVKWNTKENLENKLLEVISKELEMKDIYDVEGFNVAMGGTLTESGCYFNDGASKKAERWQILAPVRNMHQGVVNLNRLVHLTYRQKYIDIATRKFNKKIAPPWGAEGIVYGDKVINVINHKRPCTTQTGDNYIANGEIGILCGDYEFNSNKHIESRVEFQSQPDCGYYFGKNDFSEEDNTYLELAYALSVHKSQGSQFNTVVLVLSEPSRMISRELLYTALTRQTDKIIILYNDDANKLIQYASPEKSDIARRFTDLFKDVFKEKGQDVQIVKINGVFYDDKLIHRTVDGKMVRSKSEVIISNALSRYDVFYEYEKPLKLGDHTKYPDFTIENADTGKTWYWEHCGMMTDPKYKKRWEDKKKFYEKHGIREGVNLIVTYDDENGSIDSCKIDKIVKDHFC